MSVSQIPVIRWRFVRTFLLDILVFASLAILGMEASVMVGGKLSLLLHRCAEEF
jgi:hypothetical protein